MWAVMSRPCWCQGLIGQEAGVDEYRVDGCVVLVCGQLLQIGPVGCGELPDGGGIVVLQELRALFAARGEEAQFVIPKDGFDFVFPRQFEHVVAVGAAVDEVADLDDAILGLKLQRFEQFFKFDRASVHVSDCYGSRHRFSTSEGGGWLDLDFAAREAAAS
jgi:hypothetical protein